MTILFPRTADVQILGRNYKYDPDRNFLVQIFRDNNSKKRAHFFKNLLIRYLWKLFVENDKAQLIDYMKSIRSDTETGELRFIRFMQEFKSLEEQLGFELLPDEFKDLNKLTIFTQEEQNQYKLKNCSDRSSKRFGRRKKQNDAIFVTL